MYQTSDYNGAVDRFTKAFQRASDIQDPLMRGNVQVTLLFNLARAHLRAYSTDRDPVHLRTAEDLLSRYSDVTDTPENRRDAQLLMDEVQAELAKLNAGTPPIDDGPEDAPPEEEQDRRRIDPLIVGGGAALGIGVAGLGLAVGGAVLAGQAEREYEDGPTREDRDAAKAKGGTADALVIAGSAVAGIAAITGVTLIVVGARRTQRRREGGLAVAPAIAPGFAGLSLGGSF